MGTKLFTDLLDRRITENRIYETRYRQGPVVVGDARIRISVIQSYSKRRFGRVIRDVIRRHRCKQRELHR